MNASRLMFSSLIGLLLFSNVACRHSVKIASFTASPKSFTAGGTAQLCYELVNAVSARIEPNVGDLSDKNKSCVKIDPRETTNYTLSASGKNGTTSTAQLTVSVDPPPPLANIVMFAATGEPSAASPRSAVELCYEVSGATSLSIKPDIGNVQPVDKGCRTVKPNATTSYELAATGTDNQTVTRQATVTVVQPPARIVQFEVSPASIKAGEKVRLCYQVEDAAGAYIEKLNYAVKLGPAECVDVQPTRSTTFTFRARNSDGKFATREQRVTVEQPPIQIVQFNAQATEVEKGQETVLHYKLVNADKAEITADGRTVAVKIPEGDRRIRPQRTTSFTLIAKDPDGKATSQEITINVVPPAQARILKFDPPIQTIMSGKEATLCYGVTWGSKVSLYSELQKSSRNLVSSESECITVSPTATDTYKLTAKGRNGVPVTAQVRVNVRIPPPLVKFYAQSKRGPGTEIRILRGERTELCYGVSNVTSVSINPGFGSLEVSRGRCLTLNELATDTVFTLSAKGDDGTIKTQEVVVRVYPPPQIIRFDGQSNRGVNYLCYAYHNGSRAEISPSVGRPLTSSQDCVIVPSPRSPSYMLTVYGRGNVKPAIAYYPRR